MDLLRELFTLSVDLAPGTAGLGDAGSLFSHLQDRRILSEKYLGRQSLPIRAAVQTEALRPSRRPPLPERQEPLIRLHVIYW